MFKDLIETFPFSFTLIDSEFIYKFGTHYDNAGMFTHNNLRLMPVIEEYNKRKMDIAKNISLYYLLKVNDFQYKYNIFGYKKDLYQILEFDRVNMSTLKYSLFLDNYEEIKKYIDKLYMLT